MSITELSLNQAKEVSGAGTLEDCIDCGVGVVSTALGDTSNIGNTVESCIDCACGVVEAAVDAVSGMIDAVSGKNNGSQNGNSQHFGFDLGSGGSTNQAISNLNS